MAVKVTTVDKNSPAYKKGIKSGDTILTINGNEIMDVLDYRFYQDERRLKLNIETKDGKLKTVSINKGEYADLGLEFETYLMDKQHSCKNKCVFCFIDQLPKGLRDSLYFKDDDSRLSFLFGNYITLTNLSEHEIQRIINMHISPVNISVHTTNPELREKMMKNPKSGESLSVLKRFNDAGIKMNCQLVLCPGYNDGAELERTLGDLLQFENAECIAAVPVGLTKFREGLEPLIEFDAQNAAETIDIIDKYGEMSVQKYGDRRAYASDEFYLISKRDIPEDSFYGDYLQLENGVGLWSLFRKEVNDALDDDFSNVTGKNVTLVTGKSAYPLIKDSLEKAKKLIKGLNAEVFEITNNFFGEGITVAGLITGSDIYEQLKNKQIANELIIPSVMLRHEGDMFLDSMTVEELEQKLNVKITVSDCNGFDFINSLYTENKEE